MKRRGRPPIDEPKSRRKIYLVLEDIDPVWDEKEVVEFDRLWAEGADIEQIAKRFKRDPDEVLILAIDRARQGYITARRGSVWGDAWREKRRKRA